MTVEVWTKIAARNSPILPTQLDAELFGKYGSQPMGGIAVVVDAADIVRMG